MPFELTSDTIDIGMLKALLRNDQAGACVTFEGWVRDHNDGRNVTGLEYEAYEAVAVSEGTRVLDEARSKFNLINARCVHRVGALTIGELAVWVGVSSGHRAQAFDACRYIIEEVKARVPIWKKEHYCDGAHGWVNSDSTVESLGSH